MVSTRSAVLVELLLCLGLMSGPVGCQGSNRLFRSVFARTAGNALSAVASHTLANYTVDACAERCGEEIVSGCKSFDYHSASKLCKLFSVNINDPDVHLIDSDVTDHYETVYRNLFNRLPKHQLTTDEHRALPDVSVERCARNCVVETTFKCKGFNYESETRTCLLLEQTPSESNGVVRSPDSDYYERGPDGVLAHFINYGHREMHPMVGTEIYQRLVLGIVLEDCAARCLAETEFQCVSFDYTYAGVRSTCALSKYIAANVYGLGFRPSVRNNHYEKIGDSMSYFYTTPYSVVLGNNLKKYTRVTPNRCARMCLEEDTFVCKSFDYQIPDGICLLSDKAARDVGGLYSDGQSEAHHFEMIPMMDCGGTMTSAEDNFASPNWPWPYAHNERCVWKIYVSQFKVIHLHLTHFELALGSSDTCSETADRLVVSESVDDHPCGIKPHTKDIVTKGNFAIVTFTSNNHGDAKGFRAFYTAEWTCNEHMNKGPGEFASPRWPKNYPASIRCSWRLTAPPGQRVHLHMTSFDLEKHSLGHCNDRFDHVRILDGGTMKSTKIGLYCGSQKAFSVRSTGRDMFVQFVSDHDPNNSKQGFHASYEFEKSFSGNDSIQAILPFDGIVNEGQDEATLGQGKDKETGGGVAVMAEEKKGPGPKTDAVRGAGGDTAHRAYKTAMWAVACLLFLLLVATLTALFLMWRYYRRKLVKQQEVEVYERMSPEEVPLQEFDSCCAKQNNLNDSDFASPSTSSCQGAVGGFDPNLMQDNFDSKDMVVKNINELMNCSKC